MKYFEIQDDRLVSALITTLHPIAKKGQLSCCPKRPSRWHRLRGQLIVNSLRITVVVSGIRHVRVVVQKDSVRLHVLNIDGTKEWLDVLCKRNGGFGRH